MRRKVILGDAFRRVVERGDWLWPRKNMPLSPGPHLAVAAAADVQSVKGQDEGGGGQASLPFEA